MLKINHSSTLWVSVAPLSLNVLVVLTLFFCLFAVSGAENSDDEAVKSYEAGRELYNNGDYHGAAGYFEKAKFMAKNPTIRANALLALTGALRMCELPWREFQAIDELLQKYPDYTNFTTQINRQYDLASAMHGGKREPLYWALRWIPWLVDEDRTIEMYEGLLKRAPFHTRAPEAHLALAYCYHQDRKMGKSLDELRKVVKNHPGTIEAKYGALALANGLFELSKRGDGDGRYATEALSVLENFQRQYPKATEIPWVERHIAQLRDIQSQRLYQLADYYRSRGRSEASKRYLAQVLRQYPDTLSAEKSEAALARLDESFLPGDFPPEPDSRLSALPVYEIPDHAEKILITPISENNHYLLPVPDLKTPVVPAKEILP